MLVKFLFKKIKTFSKRLLAFLIYFNYIDFYFIKSLNIRTIHTFIVVI